MEHHDVIIVGGGPAGSSCAATLVRAGVDCLVLDKAAFPRTKLCAGWITPEVLDDLAIDVDAYPHGMVTYPALYAWFFGLPLRIPTPQYSIRRWEFDHWLLKQSGARVTTHEVKSITHDGTFYTIDGRFSCNYLVGAGGTLCPVYRVFFQSQQPREKTRLIVCRELEFKYPPPDDKCRLWFFEQGLAGYSWYVPKSNGFLNIGVGGLGASLQEIGDSINRHWEALVRKLEKTFSVSFSGLNPKGHSYYLRGPSKQVQIGNAFLTGDSAGLATRDMGEGIGPAIRSGRHAAEAILHGRPYRINSMAEFSFNQAPARWARRLAGIGSTG